MWICCSPYISIEDTILSLCVFLAPYSTSVHHKSVDLFLGYLNVSLGARCWWLTPVILATQEAEIRRIVF
jgi:hypothetical protein